MGIKSLTVVLGLPGSRISKVVSSHEKKGHVVLWPGQDITLKNGHYAYSQGENPEVTRMHTTLLERHKKTWCDLSGLDYYEPPVPGPQDVLNMFDPDSKVIFGDYRFCLFFSLWQEFVTNIVVCEISVEAAYLATVRWHGRQHNADNHKKAMQFYSRKLEEIKNIAVGKTVTISYDSLQNANFSLPL